MPGALEASNGSPTGHRKRQSDHRMVGDRRTLDGKALDQFDDFAPLPGCEHD